MKRPLAGLLAAIALAVTTRAGAPISDDVVKIGSSSTCEHLCRHHPQGQRGRSTNGDRRFRRQGFGQPIELVYADTRTRPIFAATKAREWLENEKVDAILEDRRLRHRACRPRVASRRQRIIVFNGPAPRAYQLNFNEACMAALRSLGR